MEALLSGVKILDFTTLLPGPCATMILSDLGAEVLRVESHTRIDMARIVPPFVDKDCKVSSMHAYLNRNKKSMALDLKYKESLSIIMKLIEEKGYDVVIEQFRPGVMERLGLSYELLSRHNPGLIYCSISGYGQKGPLRGRAGHDINYLSMSGVMSYSGSRDRGPCIMGIQVADVGSGSNNAVIGVLAAVVHRMRTGKGQHVDVSMTDGMFPYHAISGIRVLLGGKEPCYESDLLNGGSLYGFYRTKDGRFISFGGLEPQFFTAFLETLGLADYIPRLMEDGIMDEVRQKVSAIILSQSLDHWVHVFRDVDACVEPVLSVSEAVSSEHARARGIVVDVPGPDGTTIRQIASPIQFSEYKPEYRWAGPALGKDTMAVLESLGLTRGEIADMKEKGIIGVM
jgi:alpha-methylacyl-CoA racemase